ncbi:sulfatase [Haloferula sp. A504]|uniref:sulfatase n=1 Tax=Haloferula sp. A504 TaxID=3373601 RepID=UPI0031C5CA0A|nr:sulfatase-like hydrolase/transferase [Verrucomicrobiaceae bacterium E54]
MRSALLAAFLIGQSFAAPRPNIILMMADDLGWGDVGFNGGKIIETPELDRMAENGLVFDRFYSAAPVCSPTRGSCLTGRHPFRYGVFFANTGHLKASERTLPEMLGELGYATGHFGKWHLGTLLPDWSGKGKGRKPEQNHMTPAMAGFDEWFSTEYSVATWDPYDPKNQHGGGKFDPRRLFWHNGENVTGPLEGGSGRIVMDRAIPFIEKAAGEEKPFFAAIWFHAPHSPVVGGPEYRKRYAQHPEAHQHYYACVTEMDEQVGRLRAKLRELGVEKNTLLAFCSDNGPARQGDKEHVGSAGPFKGFKVSLWEGGIRVPGVVEWPGRVKPGRTDFAVVTSDYLPTIAEMVGAETVELLDGRSLLPVFEGGLTERREPIGFQSQNQLAWIEGDLKLVRAKGSRGFELHDLKADPGEGTDIAADRPEDLARMKAALEKWMASCKASNDG